jgi:hypothetical protein
MRLIPTREQFRAWSLPSKLTAIGTLLALFSLLIYVVEKTVPFYDTVHFKLFGPPGFAFMRDGNEYFDVVAPDKSIRGLKLLGHPSMEMEHARRIASDMFKGREIPKIILSSQQGFVALSPDDQTCELLIYKFRDESELEPKKEIVEGSLGLGCDIRYLRLSKMFDQAIVSWSWGGNGQFLDLKILYWDRDQLIAIPTPEWGMDTNFTFADLDGNGTKELIVGKFDRWDEETHSVSFRICELTTEKPFSYREVKDPQRYNRFLEDVPLVSDKRVWEWFGIWDPEKELPSHEPGEVENERPDFSSKSSPL